MYLLCEGEVVAFSQLVFKVEGRTTAFEASTLQEGDAVTENFSLIQVMGGKNDGAFWTVKQNEHRGMSNQRFTDTGGQRERQSLNKELMNKDKTGESDMTLFYGLKSLLEINSLTVSEEDN